MRKSQWINAMVASAMLSTLAVDRSAASSGCEIRNAMSAQCACVWATMVFNLSPETRQAVLQERSRLILPRPGEWGQASELLVQLEPWGRAYIGCRIMPIDGPQSPCSTEYSREIVSCHSIEDQS